MALQTLTIRRPDDWHVHLRDGEMLTTVAPYTARQIADYITEGDQPTDHSGVWEAGVTGEARVG